MKSKLIEKIDSLTETQIEVLVKIIENNDYSIVENYYYQREKEKKFWEEHSKPWNNTTEYAKYDTTNAYTKEETNGRNHLQSRDQL